MGGGFSGHAGEAPGVLLGHNEIDQLKKDREMMQESLVFVSGCRCARHGSVYPFEPRPTSKYRDLRPSVVHNSAYRAAFWASGDKAGQSNIVVNEV